MDARSAAATANRVAHVADLRTSVLGAFVRDLPPEDLDAKVRAGWLEKIVCQVTGWTLYVDSETRFALGYFPPGATHTVAPEVYSAALRQRDPTLVRDDGEARRAAIRRQKKREQRD
jgi:hypothetical protein